MTSLLRRRLDPAADDGLGMVELFVVMILMSVIGATLLNGMVSSFRHQRQQAAYVQTLNSMKLAFERMTRDIRAADPLVAASAESITMRIRRGPENARICKDVLLSLTAAGTTSNVVVRDPIAAAPAVMARGFTPATGANPTFRYYDQNQVELAAPVTVANVRYVGVTLRGNLQPGSPPVEFRDRIFLRNRGGKTC